MGLLQEIYPVLTRLLVGLLVVEELAGGVEFDVGGEDGFRSVDQEEWRGAEAPQHSRKFFDPTSG